MTKILPTLPPAPPAAVVPVEVRRVGPAPRRRRPDEVAAEEPMEIRVVAEPDGRTVRQSIAVTMRTPGNDFELAAGFLYSEGVIRDRAAVRAIEHCGRPGGLDQFNVVNVRLSPGTAFDPSRFSRNVYTTSSCGVCGKTSLDLVRAACPPLPARRFRIGEHLLHALPERLGKAQAIFSRTGGLHAAALFDAAGDLLLLREDVGRHNALDKVVGRLLLDGRLPAADTVVLVSGRASFELVQKALLAGIPILAAVGAPSSLAVAMARESGMTLVGFLRDGRFSVYSGGERLRARRSGRRPVTSGRRRGGRRRR